MEENIKQQIRNGQLSLGIELGSTRIKGVLIDTKFNSVASGSYNWENQLIDGNWTYSLDEVWTGIRFVYNQINQQIKSRFQLDIKRLATIGVSAMMHGFLVFDKNGKQLTPFRTWRNNTTEDAAKELSKLFKFNIPQRWSVAHLYQSILNEETFVNQISFMTTLAGYVHWKLTGDKVLGIGDASGMFPIDPATKNYDTRMIEKFNSLEEVKKYSWKISELLPKPLLAGSNASHLTFSGANWLDERGNLESGCLVAPPEGDAGTGMVATNSIDEKTGNISIGTSAFLMLVLDRSLNNYYQDIDIVMTPNGLPVAMVHINNCSSDINDWVNLFYEFSRHIGSDMSKNDIYEELFTSTAHADPDASGLLNYSFLSGENITKVKNGRPLFIRKPNSKFNIPNFFLTQLYSAFAPLNIGLDILRQQEELDAKQMVAQGGLLKTQVIVQQILANILNLPITVLKNAGDGGPWGMAILARFALEHELNPLDKYLDKLVFNNSEKMVLCPEKDGVQGFESFIDKYKESLPVEILSGKKIS